MCNKKAVLRTAFFVIRATICEQAPIVAFTTKATRESGFLVAHCARDSGGALNHLHNHLIHNFTATFNLHMVSHRSHKNSALLLQI